MQSMLAVEFGRKSFPGFRVWPVRASVQFISVAQSCPTLCDPMNHSTPGLPVHHQLPEFTQTHFHSSHSPFSPEPSFPAPSHPSLFSVSMDLPVLDISYNGIIQYVVFCDWLPLLRIIFVWFTDAVAC